MAGLIPIAALCAIRCTSSNVRIERVGAPRPTATDFPLHTEHWAEIKVAALRRQENLDAVVAGAAGEFERFLRLQSWTRAQWPLGVPDPYPPCNGVDILAAIRSGRTGGFCGQYSYLLADALKSFGYFSVRYVELEAPEGASHFIVEAWSNEHDRWVAFDPTYDVHYTDAEGRPLSALELHQVFTSGDTSGVRAVEGTPPPAGGKRIAELPDRGLSMYANIALALRSDLAHLDAPVTLAERERTFVRYADPAGGDFRQMKFALATSRAADLYPAVAQVDARVERVEGDSVKVSFSTGGSLPHFLAYQVRLDGGPWKRSGPELEWTVPPGRHLLEVAAVNVAGVAGPIFGLEASR